MFFKYLFCFSFIFLLLSCKEKTLQEKIIGKWDVRINFVVENKPKDFDLNVSKGTYDDQFYLANYFVFNENNTFISYQTEGNGGYATGKFTVNPKDSVITFLTKDSISYQSLKIKHIKSDLLCLMENKPFKKVESFMDNFWNKRKEYICDKDIKTLESDFNYTDLKYNKWRYSKVENETDIKNKLVDILKYTLLTLKNSKEFYDNLYNDNANPSPLKFYSNGFKIRNFEYCIKLKKAFIYNNENTYIAYQMMNKSFNKINFDDIPENILPIEYNIQVVEKFIKEIEKK